MNKYFVIFALFAVVAISIVKCDDSSSSEEDLLGRIKSKKLRSHISDSAVLEKVTEVLNDWCPESAEKLKDALGNMIDCTDKNDDGLTTCASIRQNAINCSKPILKVVEDCLPEKSKDLPLLIAKSAVAGLDHLCNMDGESILELANPCLMDINEDSDEAKKCKEEFTKQADAIKNEPPTKTQLCDVGKTVRSCMTKQVNGKCKNEKTKKASIEMMDAILGPCNAA